jgi:predicted ATPase
MRGSESFDKIRDEVIDKLGSENLCRLINIIPELAEVVGDDLNMENMTKQHKQGGGETKARFNYAFRVFIRVVASHFAPLVVLLDDIQWADAATLDLLQVLIADHQNGSLIMIGVYRSNEVDEVHLLSRIIRDLKRTAEQDDFNATEIEIGNLNTSQINEVIMLLLSIEEPAKTLGLANICLKRTHGNIFSLLVFLEMLQTQGLLQYSLGRFEWGWDEQRILSESDATSYVVDLMKQKFERQPSSVGQRLACLGFSFEPAILNTVWTIVSEQRNGTETSETVEDEDIDAFLALVEQEGFLEIEPDSTTAYIDELMTKFRRLQYQSYPPTSCLA